MTDKVMQTCLLAKNIKEIKGLVSLLRTIDFNFFSITGQGIDLDSCDSEWFALEMNRDHPVIFEIASKYCISDSSVDYDG